VYYKVADAMPRRVYIKTYGCQMNVYDSNRMTDALAAAGYEPTEHQDRADLIILNTCHIREKAAEKVYSEIGRLKRLKTSGSGGKKGVMIGVAGCVAQAESVEIMRRAPAVDLVFGPQSYHRLPHLVARAAAGEKVIETEFPEEDKFEHLPPATRERTIARGTSAFLTIQEGCDKFCAFCVVPYTRGTESSRPVTQIVQEATRLIEAGVREVTLLGQNVNAYHGANHGREAQEGSSSLAGLLYRLAELPGLDRLRYTTSHPRDMSQDLIDAHGDLAELMPYLHLPVQSGSDRILKAMNRRHTRDEYLSLVQRIRAARPDIALSGDFIVGFPGETDADFDDTLELIAQVNYAQAYSFKYSPRPGTPAAQSEHQLPEAVKSERLAALQQLLNEQQLTFNLGTVGKHTDVLLERPGRKPGQLVGRSPWCQAVQVVAPVQMLGAIAGVTVTKAGPKSLFGEIKDTGQRSAMVQ
jgi:tRNA-2-methylthio-N6-dimethylallyladenosine synthase